MTKIKKLNVAQRKLVYKYLQTGNAKQAGHFAYPNATPKSAGEMASVLLTKPHIRLEIEKAFQKLGMKTEQEIENIHKIANTDPREKLPSADSVINANVQLLKLRGAYDKNNINVNVSISAKLDQMTDEELKKNLQELKQRNKRILENS